MTTASVTASDPFAPILQHNFRMKEFRRGQREIIQSVLAQKDVLAVLPTGGGKSLCYQFIALHEQKLVIVISPLIALMKDQVSGLSRNGIPAGALHSGQSEDEKREIFRRMGEGGPFLLYLSPERVQKPGFQNWIKDKKIALFAVDEAHCVSQWGHDFREEYSQLKILKSARPDVPMLALTASATPLVLNDISRNLGLNKPDKHVHGFYRPNLYYQVEGCADEHDKMRYIEQALAQFPEGRVIIYCGTRNSTEDVATRLEKSFAKVGYYHAGLAAAQRTKTQKQYETGEVRILVATNAFGMGIDHPDVRLVVHYQMPANIDSLYQEMGRAGRDGEPSTCLMLYSKKDKGLQSYFIQSSEAPADIKRSRWNTLEALVSYAEGGECRHSEILTYYRDSQRLEKCGHCDSCAPMSARKVMAPPPAPRAVNAVPKPGRSRKPSSSKTAMPAGAEFNELQSRIFMGLKDWRRQKALELDAPAFVIFSDRTLRELAYIHPRNKSDLHLVHGFGEVKIEKFGDDVMAVLQDVAGAD